MSDGQTESGISVPTDPGKLEALLVKYERIMRT